MTKEQKKIILVDDNNSNLTACKKILKSYYEVYTVPSAEKMFDLLKHVIPDMILLDVEMPDMNGYEAAAALKKNAAYRDIPIVFLSGQFDPVIIAEGLNLGALDFIQKPVISALLLKRIETYLVLIDYEKGLKNGK